MGRFSRGLALTKMSFRVIRKDKEILLFPVISGIISILVLASFFGAWFFLNNSRIEGIQNSVLFYVLMFLFYLVSYFVVIFFNTALVGCAMKRLEGGDPTVGYGLSFASSRVKVILKWAMVAATVGLILRAISDRAGAIGRIVMGIIGLVWTIATYFVVPVIAFEGLGPFQAIKRSVSILKGTWGEALISNLGIGLIFMALALIGIVPLVLVAFTGNWTLMIVTFIAVVIYWLLLGVLSSAVSAVILTALYRFAMTGKTSEEFPEGMLTNPWSVGQKGRTS
jgi:hypothetical protein